ncbi:uncharacterized conserved protein [Longilinea arvoryzae]|uniref:Uncharacterized conserved protein n=1 Tax=Longilinea arvoryzae TaxID=360412 RepID=A0A0S7BHS2_9CHLR|nr:uncharacterized conserved protein [Longilinea arvoryzae]
MEHTADWAMEVWAPDLEGLFTQAALGLYRLMGVRLADAPGVSRQLEVSSADPESLLVAFLSELLFRAETRRVAFDRIILQCNGLSLQAQFEEKPLVAQARLVKAVTYHDLAILQAEDGWKVKIVFDV